MNSRTKNTERTMTDITFLFLTGAVTGWCYEVLLHVFTAGSFVNRGILHGPWLPIYGVGCLLIVGLKRLVGKHLPLYFLISTAACGVIEYVTSWAMEVIYHTRWWDYSNFRLNLNGRIFAGGLLGFGLAGCLFAYGVLPVLTKLYRKIPEKAKRSIAFLLICVFFADAVVSLLFPNAGTGITGG